MGWTPPDAAQAATDDASKLAVPRRFVRIQGPLSRLLSSDEMAAAAETKRARARPPQEPHFPAAGQRAAIFWRGPSPIVRAMWPVHKIMRDVDSGAKMPDKMINHRMSDAVQEVRSTTRA